jgi:hypothetical protein
MINCVISMEDGSALVDVRGGGLDFPDAEGLLEALQPYSQGGHVTRVVVDVRGHGLLPAPVEILLMGLRTPSDTERWWRSGAAASGRSKPRRRSLPSVRDAREPLQLGELVLRLHDPNGT